MKQSEMTNGNHDESQPKSSCKMMDSKMILNNGCFNIEETKKTKI